MSYDPTIGRFISEDPIAFDGGDADLYRYVGNSPTNFTDPSGLQAPTSITLTPPGRIPTITAPRPFRGDPQTNPWRSKGGPNQITGQRFYNSVTLEWVLTFDGPPCAGQWGRRVWKGSTDFRVVNGEVWLTSPGEDDTDPPFDYVVGNKVYMYDAPGTAIGSNAQIFEIWSKPCGGDKWTPVTSKWYYVNGGSGQAYEINAPDPYFRWPDGWAPYNDPGYKSPRLKP
jgi:uncharacterized protein RhaS with RHS repeats